MDYITLKLSRSEALNLSRALLGRLNQIEDYERKSGSRSSFAEHREIVSDIELRVYSLLHPGN